MPVLSSCPQSNVAHHPRRLRGVRAAVHHHRRLSPAPHRRRSRSAATTAQAGYQGRRASSTKVLFEFFLIQIHEPDQPAIGTTRRSEVIRRWSCCPDREGEANFSVGIQQSGVGK